MGYLVAMVCSCLRILFCDKSLSSHELAFQRLSLVSHPALKFCVRCGGSRECNSNLTHLIVFALSESGVAKASIAVLFLCLFLCVLADVCGRVSGGAVPARDAV